MTRFDIQGLKLLLIILAMYFEQITVNQHFESTAIVVTERNAF